MQASRVSTELRSLFDSACAEGARALNRAADNQGMRRVPDLQRAANSYAEAAGIATSALWVCPTRDQAAWNQRQRGARRYAVSMQAQLAELLAALA